ncbi:hypothetical protein [Burkholderia gladioli]|uniref:hypothetical protein n=1 Tax=Burkholderia gladioli TaxID=28095 RepID=UPI00163E5D14|nr:hypothetical protein [Burkholderia gladioli]
MITTSPLEKIETAIRHSVYVVALDFSKTTSDTMHMEFDATAVVSVTVEGVEHLVKVNRMAVNGCVAAEEDEKSGYATLKVALDKALGEHTAHHRIDRAIFRTAERALGDSDDAREGKVTSLVNTVRAATARDDMALSRMVAELLVRTLLERHAQVLNAVKAIRGLVHLVSIDRLPGDSLTDVLREFGTVHKRVKNETGVSIEALRKASEVPVAEVADVLDTLYTDVVLP